MCVSENAFGVLAHDLKVGSDRISVSYKISRCQNLRHPSLIRGLAIIRGHPPRSRKKNCRVERPTVMKMDFRQFTFFWSKIWPILRPFIEQFKSIIWLCKNAKWPKSIFMNVKKISPFNLGKGDSCSHGQMTCINTQISENLMMILLLFGVATNMGPERSTGVKLSAFTFQLLNVDGP